MNMFCARNRNRGKKILQTQRGAAAVEFAILLPFLVVLVFGIIEFGLLLYNQQVITNASREGARAAIVGDCDHRLTDAQIGQIVTDYCVYTDTSGNTRRRLITFNTTNNPPSTTVTPSPKDCILTVGQDVEVRVDYNYTFLVPSILGFGPTKLLRARTVMKMESAP